MNPRAPKNPNMDLAKAQAQRQAQSVPTGAPAMPGGMPSKDRVTTQFQAGLKNQLGGKPMGGGTLTMPDGTMMPNKAMPMPAPMPKPGYGGTAKPMPMPRPMPGQKPMGNPMPRPMPRPMKPNKPMKPKPMPPGTVGPIGL